MTIRLRDLITLVRNARTAQEEREVVSKEAAEIRNFFSKDGPDDNYYRPRNVAKLLFMNMLGYPTHWGQLECLKLIVQHEFVDKRIGYLALNVLLDENTEILMLATQALKTDVMNPNHYIAGLALTTLGNIASEQICRDCAPEIEQLCDSDDPYIRKKALLCALKVARKVPDLVEPYLNKLKGYVSDRDHGVLVAAIAFISHICAGNLQIVRQKLTKPLVALLKQVTSGGFNPDYEFAGIPDPFLQVGLLRVLRQVGVGHAQASEQMNDILIQILSNTDTTKSIGLAILYEAISTALAIESDKELKLMAINILGKFLANKDNNIRYVGLTTLTKVVQFDSEAVQRHRAVVVECLKDGDLSIRKRALHLIYALVDDSTARLLVRDLLSFLLVADRELRGDLTVNLCYVVEKYSPSSRFYVDSIMRVMSIAGDFVPEEIQGSYISTIIRSPDLHAYTVVKAYLALREDGLQNTLAQVAAWCVGEYGDLLVSQPSTEEHTQPSPDEVVDLLASVAKSHSSDDSTKEYVLNALFKLTTRLPQSVLAKIRGVVRTFAATSNVELQQRAIEYDQLFDVDDQSRLQLLAKMPAAEIKLQMPAGVGSAAPLSSSNGSSSSPPMSDKIEAVAPLNNSLVGDLLGASSAPAAPAASGVSNDLMSILGGPAAGVSVGSQPAAAQGAQDILALFGAPGPVPMQPGVANPWQSASLPGMAPMAPSPFGGDSGIPSMIAFQNAELMISFNFKKPNPQQPQFTLIAAAITNTAAAPIGEFNFLAAPPKHVKYILDAPSTTVIAPGTLATLMIKAANSSFGEKPLSMKMRISYTINGQRREFEEVNKNPFPAGC